MNLSNVLIVYTHPAIAESKVTLEIVKKVVRKYKIHFNLADRDNLKEGQFQNRDLIIAVGGDGTFLRAAQFVKSQLIFGVNADVKNKEGFFMQSSKKDFEAKLKKIIGGRFSVKKMPRLEACINNKKIETLALNEFFVGPKKSYHAAKYVIYIGETKERQKSSGILVTTPAGSYAWSRACCKKTLNLNSDKFQFVVREPYEGKVFKNYRLGYGILGKSKKVTIISEMLDGIMIADSVGKEYSFKNGSKAVIKLSKKTLNEVWMKG